MTFARLCYRTRQFWNYLGAQTPSVDWGQVRQALGSELMELFTRMQPGEQTHSFQVYWRLVENGENDPDLLRAALLHDVGKCRYPLRLWERVWIVVGKKLFPAAARTWGEAWNEGLGWPTGFRRAFVIAEQHPEWGAQMAEDAGAGPRVVRLIRRHQDMLAEPLSEEDRLLQSLQSVDDAS